MNTALHSGASSDTTTVRLPDERDARVLVDGEHSQHLRWRPGERLEHLFEQQCERLHCERATDRLCVDTRGPDASGIALTYGEVDARANQLARHLLARGI